MPTYLYLCEKNNEEFEEFHSVSEELEECPICKSKNLECHKPKKLINSTAKGVVELYGKDLINKVKEDAAKIKRESYKNEKLYANLLGENKYQSIQSSIDKK